MEGIRRRVLLVSLVVIAVMAAACSSSKSSSADKGSGASTSSTTAEPSQPLEVTWFPGFDVPGTPSKYNKVGVIHVGAPSAKNILVLEPGTSAGGAYFVPLARSIVAKAPEWQVWSVERRENLIEDQTELDSFKNGEATSAQLFDYYLGYLKDPTVTQHFQLIPDADLSFAKQWGMQVAVEDLRRVIEEAQRAGGKVVLGGHSLGGSVVTAYATWNVKGRPGAADLAGLVYIDGASRPTPVTAEAATTDLKALYAPTASPWLSFGGITTPYAGVFNATGSLGALRDPDAPSRGQASGLLPADIVPKERVTNAGQYGFALNVGTSPKGLAAAQAHLGSGIAKSGTPRGWNGSGAISPLDRYATMFSGAGVRGADGTEWYFPRRLTQDAGAVANGNANPAQDVLGILATKGHDLPKNLLIYAFAASLGGTGVLDATRELAKQSSIPSSNVTLVDRHDTYAHNDPAGASPRNDFLDALLRMLTKAGRA